MIPKVIHYCWFGRGKKPRLVRKCIKSWKKYCPDYKIIEWNEDNCDLDTAPLFVRQAIKAKKWGFVSDYCRLKIVYENGGFYLDTDVELIKSLNQFLNDASVFSFHGSLVNLGQGFGARKGSSILLELMQLYDEISFIRQDESYDLTTCTVRETPVFLRHGLQQNNTEQILDEGIHIFPKEYFDPGNWGSFFVYKTRNTVAIHRYMSSWYDKKAKRKYLCTKWKNAIRGLPHFTAFKLRNGKY